MKLELLAEDCFAHILSFTSPKDACCLSMVSSELRSLADSDSVWEKFLPSDYPVFVSELAFPLICNTKKHLFFRLCNPHFIDQGRKIISLDKSTGKKIYLLSARDLSILCANNPLYWSWKPHLHSRFSEVAELRTICWVQINGKINTQKLSPRTEYGAYLLVKFADRAYGLDTLPSEVFVKVGNLKSQGKVHLRRQQKKIESNCGSKKKEASRSRFHGSNSSVSEREDGWIEIEIGCFYNDGEEDMEMEMGLKEMTGEHLKGGLIVEGIQIRPKH